MSIFSRVRRWWRRTPAEPDIRWLGKWDASSATLPQGPNTPTSVTIASDDKVRASLARVMRRDAALLRRLAKGD